MAESGTENAMTEGGMHQSQYGRVVLKLSGEAFADRSLGFGIANQ